MIFYKKITFSVITGLLLAGIFSSCQEDLTTIGDGVIGGEPFETGKAVYDVFAYNKKINSVKTNNLPVYQLGNFIDPIYGKTTASITTQIQLSAINPTFGAFTQETEDGAETDESVTTISENETVKEVYLFIPYLKNIVDTDGDGVPDELDIDPADANSDTDGDGVSDNDERLRQTNPLSTDTDGDGILDGIDTENNVNAYPKKYVLDSIYGTGKAAPFNVKVERSTYFLRDLDPNTNFEQAQEFFSNQEFSPTFVSDVLYDGQETVRDTDILFFKTDDPDTEDVNESLEVDQTIAPGIWVPLNKEFFQENIIDKEGSQELLNSGNFKEFLRGIHISISESDDIFMLLNLAGANITITYEYDSVDNNGTTDDATDDSVVKLEKRFVLNLVTGGDLNSNGSFNPIVGNAVNTFVNEAYPTEILDALNSTESAERIYLKGGAGAFAEIKLFDEDATISKNVIKQLKANNWIINEANLVFYVDRETLDASSGNLIEPLRLYLYNAETNDPLYNPFTELNVSGATSLNTYPFYDGVLSKENNKGVKYKIRITDYINDLIVRDAENATLGLTVTSDIRIVSIGNAMLNSSETKIPVMSTVNPFGTVLYGNNVSGADSSKKLQLEILYTKLN
tara:strand:+ start:81651 stop:83528 length:1878 start_codon:yes stop_codon:yes gene_type:complete